MATRLPLVLVQSKLTEIVETAKGCPGRVLFALDQHKHRQQQRLSKVRGD